MKWHFGNNNTNGEKQQRMSPPPTIPQREFPLSHPAVEAILCENCRSLEVSVFDPSCPTCSDILKDQETTSIAHILAILRQWVPQIQQNIDLFMKEILLRGAHPDDRDSLTDMTLLHFACKAGASGVGDMHAAAKVVELLLSRSASLSLRCRWTQMTPIHYAAFFDSPLVLRILLKKSGGDGVSDGCPEYDNGSPLHIAASNLCYDSARVLLEFGAKTKQMDDLGRTPLECIPDPSSFRAIPNVQEVIGKLSRLLSHKNSMASEAVRKLSSTVNGHGNGTANGYRDSPSSLVSGRALLTAMGIRVGDRVAVNGNRSGILRYCGTTEFAPGIWAGCEMATTEGKNNGSVNGVVYFQCKENHGLFTPISRISKLGSSPDRRRASSTGNLRARWGGVKTDGIRSKIFRSPGDKESPTFEVGQRVLVSSGGRMKGTVRYAGPVQFANGFWYGVELDYPEGRNDGSVQGIRYFTCQLGYGIFCPPGRIHQIPPSPSSSPVPNGNSTDGKSVTTPLSTGQQNGSTDSHVNGSDKEDPLEAGFAVNRSFSMRVHRRRSMSSVSARSTAPAFTPWQAVIPAEEEIKMKRKEKKRDGDQWLTVGMTVLYKRQVAVVKYIGTVDFAPGVFLGLELKSGDGKHDGFVQGRRYFHCRPKAGVLVKPAMVSVHGINGAKLIKEHVHAFG